MPGKIPEKTVNKGGRPKGSLNKATLKVRQLAQKYTKTALKTLGDIAERGESEAARVSASTALLDRGHGKPAQAITGEGGEGPVRIVVETGISRE